MGLPKGKTNNPKGRKRGVPNKVTKQLRELIKGFLNDNFEQVKQDFAKLEPKDRIRNYIDLLQYTLPKYQSINLDIEGGLEIYPKEIKIQYVPLSKPIATSEAEVKELEGIK